MSYFFPDKNTEVFLHVEELGPQCMRFLSVTLKGQGRVVQQAVTHCLFSLSQTEVGRKEIVAVFDVPQ